MNIDQLMERAAKELDSQAEKVFLEPQSFWAAKGQRKESKKGNRALTLSALGVLAASVAFIITVSVIQANTVKPIESPSWRGLDTSTDSARQTATFQDFQPFSGAVSACLPSDASLSLLNATAFDGASWVLGRDPVYRLITKKNRDDESTVFEAHSDFWLYCPSIGTMRKPGVDAPHISASYRFVSWPTQKYSSKEPTTVQTYQVEFEHYNFNYAIDVRKGGNSIGTLYFHTTLNEMISYSESLIRNNLVFLNS